MSDELVFERTCLACPEQYVVWMGDRTIGYMRLRWGHFHVLYFIESDPPNPPRRTIYEADTIGDGMFTDEERDYHLGAARDAFIAALRAEGKIE